MIALCLGFRRYPFAFFVAAALLPGCGGLQPPIGAPGAMPQSRAIATHAAHGRSWMLPEAKSMDLLYISDAFNGDVFVYSFQKHNQVGDLTGLDAYGLCVDAAGNVYVTNAYPPQVLEYAHGGTQPIKILTGAGNAPGACSVDPTTGNLGVANFTGPNFLAVYKHASGVPRLYQDLDMTYMFYCGYDGSGNLFADGQSGVSGYYKNRFLELPKGRNRLVRVHRVRADSGNIQWDGRYLAVGSGSSLGTIDQFKVKHREGIKKGSTQLEPPEPFNQFWIVGGTVVAQDSNLDRVDYFRYPSGGYSFASISVSDPYGVTVSLASR